MKRTVMGLGLGVLGLAAGLGGCRAGGSRYAAGSGYGVGVPRANWTFGKDYHAKKDRVGIEGAPVEQDIGRIKHPPAKWPSLASHLPMREPRR
jgi:hypothetical protein